MRKPCLPHLSFLLSVLVLLVSLVFAAKANAQNCTKGDITFYSQADITTFANANAGCTNITVVGNLIIGYLSGNNYTNITDLSPLSKIKTVTGSLRIRFNPDLYSLDGLALTNIGGLLYIYGNPNLTNINGLSALTSSGFVEIAWNQALTNLNGLSNLTTMSGSVKVYSNNILTNISGLRNINPAGIGGADGLFITNNPQLAVCNLPNFCTYLAGSGARTISGNKTTCLNEAAVTAACASVCNALSGTDLILRTQQDVDNFTTNYAHCTDISVNNLIIGYDAGITNSDIINISALSNIKTVTGNIIIRRNPNLTLLNGLQNITSFSGDLRIEKCYALTDITSLAGITQARYLNIRDNNELQNLNGLHNLAQITGSGSSSGYLYIYNNGKLNNMDALQNLTSIGNYIEIQINPVLPNLNGLSGVTSINGSILIQQNDMLTDISGMENINALSITALTIRNNPELAVCNLANFCTYLAHPVATHPRTISGNKTTCENEQAVLETCIPFGPDNNNILYVNSSVSGGNSKGYNWANAVPRLADALKWAKEQYDANNTVFDANPLKIYVAQGSYKPLYRADNLDGNNPQDRDNAFVLVKNVQLYGGFAGSETTLEGRNYGANPTILSGDIDGISGLSADDVHHVVIAAGDVGSALLDGFTVSGGYVTSGDGNTSITVNGTPVRYERGAGLSLNNSSPQVRNTVFTGNSAYAGVVSHTNSNATFVNTLFTGNTATYGTVYNTASSPVFVNITISGNTGGTNDNNGTAMRNVAVSTPKIYNSIIWGNQTASGSVSNIFDSGGENASTPEYYHSLVQGITTTANGNLNGSTNPMFTDAANGDYRPEAGSPVINAGNNTYFEGLNTGSRDLAGNPRVLRHHIDLGAYESDCSGYTLASDAEAGRPLTPGDNYLYSSCSLLAVVRPENATGDIAVLTTSAGDLIGHNNARYVRRYYDLSAENTGDVEVTLFFTQADFDHYNSTFGDAHNASLPEHLRVARYNGAYSVSGTTLSSETKPSFIHNQSVQWSETLGLWEVTFTTSGFSGFFITGQSDDALPVTLVSFTAMQDEQSVLLEWHTVSEMNTSRYEIQRSDGRLWKAIGEVAAAGESDAPLVYRYRDLRPLPGLSYYRLKMIDRAGDRGDGAHTYSNIRSVVAGRDTDMALLIYPNPATSSIYLDTKADISEVLLWDITGRLMKMVRYQEGTGITLDGLGSGMLLVEVRLVDGTSRTGRVVVQP